MVPVLLRVVLDANALFPFTLRDTLLRAAAAGFYQLYWSEEILDEVRRSLVGTMRITDEQADRLLGAMTEAFPEAAVTGYETLVPDMRNNEQDRHVAAAAAKAGAQLIVTSNLKDFQDLPEGIEAQSPDEFLRHLFDREAEDLLAILRQQAAALRRPPISFEELLGGLAKLVPGFVTAVREHLAAP